MNINKFDLIPDKSRVLEACGCNNHDDAYEQMAFKYDQLITEFLNTVQPAAGWQEPAENKDPLIESSDCMGMVLVLATLGEGINELINEKFLQGAYMDGIMLDAMAVAYLFAMEERIDASISGHYMAKGLFVSGRYSPGDNIPMAYNKLIAEHINIGVAVSENNMLTPIKSISYILTLGCGRAANKAVHECSACNLYACPYRKREKVMVSINTGGNHFVFETEKGMALSRLLEQKGILVQRPCGGKGVCGKCKVIVNGKAALACKYMIESNADIKLIKQENDVEIQQDFIPFQDLTRSRQGGYGIAVDLGTTTVVMTLVSQNDKAVLARLSFLNPQKQFGGDVISRIEYANGGGLDEMASMIKKELQSGFCSLLKRRGIHPDEVNEIIISGNTVMAHILVNAPLSSLGVAPYKPSDAYFHEAGFDYHNIFCNSDLHCPVRIVPYVSAFVGGDIVSGIHYLSSFADNFLLMDLGTNGEIALKKGNRIICTATAAGPAFEGGNMVHGTGSVQGAICKVQYKEGKFVCHTIGGGAAIGICGSGMISLVARLLENRLMDRTGLLREPYFSNGIPLGGLIQVTQNDIRQFQMAKGAIRAGAEILLSMEEISGKLFISGGFGNALDTGDAVLAGIIPKCGPAQPLLCGNSSLGGAVKLLGGHNIISADEIVRIAGEINLSGHPDFEKLYMKHIDF